MVLDINNIAQASKNNTNSCWRCCRSPRFTNAEIESHDPYNNNLTSASKHYKFSSPTHNTAATTLLQPFPENVVSLVRVCWRITRTRTRTYYPGRTVKQVSFFVARKKVLKTVVPILLSWLRMHNETPTSNKKYQQPEKFNFSYNTISNKL